MMILDFRPTSHGRETRYYQAIACLSLLAASLKSHPLQPNIVGYSKLEESSYSDFSQTIENDEAYMKP